MAFQTESPNHFFLATDNWKCDDVVWCEEMCVKQLQIQLKTHPKSCVVHPYFSVIKARAGQLGF